MIWQAGDDRNKQHLSWQYFNPVIYTNLSSYGLDNKNNILTGADIKLKLANKLTLYGQLMLDKVKKDSITGAWGWQGGITYFDALGIKNFFLQVEFNNVKQGSYLNPDGSSSDQSYSHYNQTLAYTPGNGQEFVAIADYKFKRFFTNVRYNYQEVPQGPGNSADISYVNMLMRKWDILLIPHII